MRHLVLLCVAIMMLSATTAVAAELPPTVKAVLSGGKLVLTFPADTIQGSVSLKAHGKNVYRRHIWRNKKTYTWTSPTELSIDMSRCHCQKGCCPAAQPMELWVWGQLKNGEALLQKVTVNQ